MEHESLAQQTGVVIERRAVEQPQTARIHEDLRTRHAFEQLIVLLRRSFTRNVYSNPEQPTAFTPTEGHPALLLFVDTLTI